MNDDSHTSSTNNDAQATKSVLRKMMLAAFFLMIVLFTGLNFMSRYMGPSHKKATSDNYSNRNSDSQPIPEIPGFKWPKGPVFISFWASWCAPCIDELPLINEVAKELPQVQFVLINLDKESPDHLLAAENFLTTLGPIHFQHFYLDTQVFQAFGASVLPYHLLADKNKKLIWKIEGSLPHNKSSLRQKFLQSISANPK